MSDWFTPQQAGYIGGIGGAVLGTLGGVYGAMAGILAHRGVARRAMLTLHVVLLCAGVVILGVGLTAVLVGQPYHVSYPFVLCGLIVTIVTGVLYKVVRAQYRMAEQRRLQSEELRRG